MKNKPKRIALLTGGGDCAGLNAVIRAVTKKAILELGLEVFGFEDGYEGLIKNKYRKLELNDVSGILTLGGTILGTSNKTDPYRCAGNKGKKTVFIDRSAEAIKNVRGLAAQCLVAIGGDGTLTIANSLNRDGLPIIGVPKTIDNDIRGTEIAFGFDSAVEVATDGVDRVHSTAQSHHRVLIVEVMGRTAGWIALHAGIAGGGDIILIPEIPYRIDRVIEKVQERSRKGKRFSIIVVAEGAKPAGGRVTVQRIVKDSPEKVRLGGVGFVLADEIERRAGIEARTVVLGHLQRGGTPSSFDRILATRLGTRAVDMIKEGRFGYMVGVQGDELVDVPLEEVAKGPRLIPPGHQLILAGRSIGVSFGE